MKPTVGYAGCQVCAAFQISPSLGRPFKFCPGPWNNVFGYLITPSYMLRSLIDRGTCSMYCNRSLRVSFTSLSLHRKLLIYFLWPHFVLSRIAVNKTMVLQMQTAEEIQNKLHTKHEEHERAMAYAFSQHLLIVSENWKSYPLSIASNLAFKIPIPKFWKKFIRFTVFVLRLGF